jgi:hypothetical protein
MRSIRSHLHGRKRPTFSHVNFLKFFAWSNDRINYCTIIAIDAKVKVATLSLESSQQTKGLTLTHSIDGYNRLYGRLYRIH